MSKIQQAIRITGIMLAATVMAVSSAAAGVHEKMTDGSARAGIQATLDRTSAVLRINGSAQQFADAFYAPDLMITGEGEKTYRDLKSFMPFLAAFLPSVIKGDCHIRIVGPVRHSGNLASAFTQDYCKPVAPGKPAASYRMLLVFSHGPKGWRVVQELFVSGSF